MELFFEDEDFAAFMDKLKAYGNTNFLHPHKKYSWQQSIVRIYDPDFHIIEIGEDMCFVIKRLIKEGRSVEETAKIVQNTEEYVLKLYKNK